MHSGFVGLALLGFLNLLDWLAFYGSRKMVFLMFANIAVLQVQIELLESQELLSLLLVDLYLFWLFKTEVRLLHTLL